MEKYDIVVVDDNEDFRELIRDFLTKQPEVGNVFLVESGESALKLLETTKPSVILMDIIMPGMNGYETSERIRQIYVDIPIIILTGNEAIDYKEAFENLKLNGYLHKTNIASDLMPAIFKAIR